MRFKKGSKVEVLSKRKVPSGSWISAEIICGNGHNYTVRYDGHQSNIDEAIVERVPGSAIRPCPPPVGGPEGWIPGDIVEVFDNFSWKMATVSKVLGKKYFLVRHLGSSLEFKVRKYDLRVRQSWQDDKWIVIGKVGFNWCIFTLQDILLQCLVPICAALGVFFKSLSVIILILSNLHIISVNHLSVCCFIFCLLSTCTVLGKFYYFRAIAVEFI